MANPDKSTATADNLFDQTSTASQEFVWKRDDHDRLRWRLYDKAGRRFQTIWKAGSSWWSMTGESFKSLSIAKGEMEQWALNQLAQEQQEKQSRAEVSGTPTLSAESFVGATATVSNQPGMAVSLQAVSHDGHFLLDAQLNPRQRQNADMTLRGQFNLRVEVKLLATGQVLCANAYDHEYDGHDCAGHLQTILNDKGGILVPGLFSVDGATIASGKFAGFRLRAASALGMATDNVTVFNQQGKVIGGVCNHDLVAFIGGDGQRLTPADDWRLTWSHALRVQLGRANEEVNPASGGALPESATPKQWKPIVKSAKAPLSPSVRAQLKIDASNIRLAAGRKGLTCDAVEERIESEAARKHFELGCWLYHYSKLIGKAGAEGLTARVECAQRLYAAGITSPSDCDFRTAFDFGERQFDTIFEMGDADEVRSALRSLIPLDRQGNIKKAFEDNGWPIVDIDLASAALKEPTSPSFHEEKNSPQMGLFS